MDILSLVTYQLTIKIFILELQEHFALAIGDMDFI